MHGVPENNKDKENAILTKFFENMMDESIKKMSKLGISKMPTKFKIKVEFGDGEQIINFIAKMQYDLKKIDEKQKLENIEIINKVNMITVIIDTATQISPNNIKIDAKNESLFVRINDIVKSINLSRAIDAENSYATIKNGIIEINMPFGNTKKRQNIKIVDINAEKS